MVLVPLPDTSVLTNVPNVTWALPYKKGAHILRTRKWGKACKAGCNLVKVAVLLLLVVAVVVVLVVVVVVVVVVVEVVVVVAALVFVH
jgi:hypothetical protein